MLAFHGQHAFALGTVITLAEFRPALGERWPSRLVATAAEDRLTFRRNSKHDSSFRLSQCHRDVLISHSQYKLGGKALHTIRRTRRCHTPIWRRAQNAVCLNGVGHDGDGYNAASSDASNFRTLMLPAGGGRASSRGRFAYKRHRPAIAYSRVGTGRTPSAVPSSSNFPASHLGSELGLIAQSYRAFVISATVAALYEPRNDIVSQRSGLYAVVVYRGRLRNRDKSETVE